MHQNRKNKFTEYKDFIEEIEKNNSLELSSGDINILERSLDHPSMEQINKLNTFNIVYQVKKQENMTANIMNAFNVLSNNLKNNTERIIASNKQLSDSNEHYLRRTKVLTIVIAIATVIQAGAAIRANFK